MVLFVFTTATAQNKRQQQTLDRILRDQKAWQQSKMPTQTYFNHNYAYKVPRFPTSNLPMGGLSYYEINPIPKAQKTNLSYKLKFSRDYPFYKDDSIFKKNNSFLKFTPLQKSP
jgi:hypothetical protein